ncbi:hypothetical protein ACWGJX_03615 [Streptomyces sp. NPDC054775]
MRPFGQVMGSFCAPLSRPWPWARPGFTDALSGLTADAVRAAAAVTMPPAASSAGPADVLHD